jgi:hypothetical protein
MPSLTQRALRSFPQQIPIGSIGFLLLLLISSCSHLTWKNDCNRLLKVHNEVIEDLTEQTLKNSSVSEINWLWIQSTYESANVYEQAARKYASIEVSDETLKDLQKHQILMFQNSANFLRKLAKHHENLLKNPTRRETREEQEAIQKQSFEIDKDNRIGEIFRYCKVWT